MWLLHIAIRLHVLLKTGVIQHTYVYKCARKFTSENTQAHRAKRTLWVRQCNYPRINSVHERFKCTTHLYSVAKH